jgi:hypothetical protein
MPGVAPVLNSSGLQQIINPVDRLLLIDEMNRVRRCRDLCTAKVAKLARLCAIDGTMQKPGSTTQPHHLGNANL